MRRVPVAQSSAFSAISAVGCCPGASWPQSVQRYAEGNPLANEYDESFDGRLLDELVNREILYALAEAKVLVENWRRECSILRPCSSLGYLPPAPEALVAVGGEALDCLEKRTEHWDRSAAEVGAA